MPQKKAISPEAPKTVKAVAKDSTSAAPPKKTSVAKKPKAEAVVVEVAPVAAPVAAKAAAPKRATKAANGKAKTAVAAAPAPVATPVVTVPVEEEVARLAYHLWLDSGCPDGRDMDYWLKAEQLVSKNGI